MKKAIFPGSFDPFTVGHMDILKRACQLFDEVIVCVIPNPAKNPMFTAEERAAHIKRAIDGEGITNAGSACYSGLTVDCAKSLCANYIVRGLRSYADFEFETGMEYFNKRLAPQVKTVYLACDSAHIHISSSAVRELIEHNVDIGAMVPREIYESIRERLTNNEQ